MKRSLSLVFAILVSFSFVACRGPYQLSGQEQALAENGARQWAERTGGKYLNCSPQDSERDSYVTCTIENAQKQTEEFLCAYAGSQVGCKRKTAQRT